MLAVSEIPTWPVLDVHLGLRAPNDSIYDQLALVIDTIQPLGIDEQDGKTWRIYFLTSQDRDSAIIRIKGALESDDIKISKHEFSDQDWPRITQNNLRSTQIDRLIIAPPWDPPLKSNLNELCIIVEPSTGFGTGHHPSTRLCLRALQSLSLSGKSVLDVGTGSGVLAASAVLLGAKIVTALDQDADAVDSAKDTFLRNGLSHQIKLVHKDFSVFLSKASDIVIANLTSASLIHFATKLMQHVLPGGWLVLSGFTIDHSERVREHFREFDHIARQTTEGDWVALMLKNAGPTERTLRNKAP